MIHSAQGVIHGKQIELTVDPGFQPGETVEVLVKSSSNKPRIWGEGIMRSAGAFAGTEEDDRILADAQVRAFAPTRFPARIRSSSSVPGKGTG